MADILRAVDRFVQKGPRDNMAPELTAWLTTAGHLLLARVRNDSHDVSTQVVQKRQRLLRAIQTTLARLRDGEQSQEEHAERIRELRKEYTVRPWPVTYIEVDDFEVVLPEDKSPKRVLFALESDDGTPILDVDTVLHEMLSAANPAWSGKHNQEHFEAVQDTIDRISLFAKGRGIPNVWALVAAEGRERFDLQPVGGTRRTIDALQRDLAQNWQRPLRRCQMPSRDPGRIVCNRLFWGKRRGRGAECPECARLSSRTQRYCLRQPASETEYRKAKERLKKRVRISKSLKTTTLERYKRIMTKHRNRPTSLEALRSALNAATPTPAPRGPKPKRRR